MATTGKKSHRGPVYRCQRCPWEGDKKGVSFHVITQHREVMEAPYYCLICPAKFTSAKPWRRHRSTPGHRVRSVLRGEEAGVSMGQGGKPLLFEGDAPDAQAMSKSYSDRFWALFTQAGQVPDDAPGEDTENEAEEEAAPEKTVPATKSANVTPEETMPVSKSPDLGSCTPCSIVLEDVVDLGLSPLGSFSPGCPAVGKDDQEVPVKDNNAEVLDADAVVTSLPSSATQVEEARRLKDADDDNMTELMASAEASSHERSQPDPQDVVEQEDVVMQVDREMQEPPVVAVAAEVDGESDDDDWEPGTCPGVPRQPRGVRADTRSRPIGRGRSFAQWAGTALPTPFTTSQTSIVDLPCSTQPSSPSTPRKQSPEVRAEANVQDIPLMSSAPVAAAPESAVRDGPMVSPVTVAVPEAAVRDGPMVSPATVATPENPPVATDPLSPEKAPPSGSAVDLGLAYARMGEAAGRIITEALTTAINPLVEQALVQNKMMEDVRKDRELLIDLQSATLNLLKELKPLIRNIPMAQSTGTPPTKSTSTPSTKSTSTPSTKSTSTPSTKSTSTPSTKSTSTPSSKSPGTPSTPSTKTTGASLTSSGPSATKSGYIIPKLTRKSASSAGRSSSGRRSPSPRRHQTGGSKKRSSHHSRSHSASHSRSRSRSHSRGKRSRHHWATMCPGGHKSGGGEWRGPIIFHPGLLFSPLSFTRHALKSSHFDTGQHCRIITVVYNQSPVYYLWLYLLSNCHLVVLNT